jgi:hypothetical protein
VGDAVGRSDAADADDLRAVRGGVLEQPQLNWATFAVYLMTDYGVPQSAAIQVTRVLTAVGTPCNAETIKQVTEALKDRKGL